MQTLYDYTTRQFSLFQGKRSDAEDAAILDLLETACVDEVLAFVEEELSEEERAKVAAVLDKYDDTTESATQLFVDMLAYCDEYIPDCMPRLTARLENFIERVAAHAA